MGRVKLRKAYICCNIKRFLALFLVMYLLSLLLLLLLNMKLLIFDTKSWVIIVCMKLLLQFASFISNDLVHSGVCPLTKHKRLYFPISKHKSSIPFELVHSDHLGPFLPSIEGFWFFLTIGDDYYQKNWIFLFKSKYDTRTLLLYFVAMVETQFAYKIKTIHIDHGCKFAMNHFFSQQMNYSPIVLYYHSSAKLSCWKEAVAPTHS